MKISQKTQETNVMRWNDEANGVFACKCDGRIVARVVRELKSWEWASYKGGWTHAAGKEASFAEACKAAEASVLSLKQ